MKPIKINPAYVIICSLYFLLISLPTSCGSIDVKITNPETIDLQGHRGARGLMPENTWPAFQEAYRHGMTTLELDTVLTKDNKIIVHHDSSTNPEICQNSDGSRIVKTSLYELTLSELQKLDCGSLKHPKFQDQQPLPGTRLLSIYEFFKKTKQLQINEKAKVPLRYNIETKFPDNEFSKVSAERMELHVSRLIQAVKKSGQLQNTTIQSFYLPSLLAVKSRDSSIKTSALFKPTYFQGFLMLMGLGDSFRNDILDKAEKFKADIISPYTLYVTAEFVKNAHLRNIKVIPWTVNEKKEMKRLVEAGVDGMISDYPDRLRVVIDDLKKNK